MNSFEEAQNYMSLGYAIISNKHNRARRIDRLDWKSYCKERNLPVDEDWYRRNISNDEVEVSWHVRRNMVNSRDFVDSRIFK